MFEEYGNIILIDANLLASNINTEEANTPDRKKNPTYLVSLR
jgi:hypothetical protein